MTQSMPPASGLPGANPTPPAGQKRFTERRFDGPRRVKNGLKLSTREGAAARNRIATQWMQAIEARIAPEIMQQGLEYARSGQIVSLQTLAGEIDARVQGTAARPYVTRIAVPALNERQWQAMIESMAAEAIHVAKLLAGELPPALDEMFLAHGVTLAPTSEALRFACTCPTGIANADASGGRGCKHAAAAANLVADQLSEQPLLIFALLGLPSDRLIERLQQARTLHTHGVAAAHSDTSIPGSLASVPALETLIEDFWRGAGDLEQATLPTPSSPVRHALLRRLGPSPLKGKFPMVGLLASIYDAVSQQARRRSEGNAVDEKRSE